MSGSGFQSFVALNRFLSPTNFLKSLITFLFNFQGIEELESSEKEKKPGLFNGDFHMEFCDNKKQLFQAYFRDFQIEHLDNPYKAFTDGWHAEITAKKLGESKFESNYIELLTKFPIPSRY